PLGAGMEEIYQVTSALKHLEFGKEVALLTDGRFSGVSTGACIGHLGPEALAGGPIGKVRDGDLIRIEIDCRRLEGRIDLVGDGSRTFDAEEGARVLSERPPRGDLAAGRGRRPAGGGGAVRGGGAMKSARGRRWAIGAAVAAVACVAATGYCFRKVLVEEWYL